MTAYIKPFPNHTQQHSIKPLPGNTTTGAETIEHVLLALHQSQEKYNDRNPQQL